MYLQDMQSNSLNQSLNRNNLELEDECNGRFDKIVSNISNDGEQSEAIMMASYNNFTHSVWERMKLINAALVVEDVNVTFSVIWNSLADKEKEEFNGMPSEELLNKCLHQFSSCAVSQKVCAETTNHIESQSEVEENKNNSAMMISSNEVFPIQEPSQDESTKLELKCVNENNSSYEGMLQSNSVSWQVTNGETEGMEAGECVNKSDMVGNSSSILDLDHLEGQLLIGVGMPEWGEVLQKEDEGRLLGMNLINCDAEKRMLRATLVERMKEINRLQRELSCVFRIIHQLKQENEYLTQQQQFAQLQHSGLQHHPAFQQQTTQHLDSQQSQTTTHPVDTQHQQSTDTSSYSQNSLPNNSAVVSPSNTQSEFAPMQSSTCETSQQNDQIFLLELLNHIPPPTVNML